MRRAEIEKTHAAAFRAARYVTVSDLASAEKSLTEARQRFETAEASIPGFGRDAGELHPHPPQGAALLRLVASPNPKAAFLKTARKVTAPDYVWAALLCELQRLTRPAPQDATKPPGL